ncbi:MAG: hypothetical protein HY699_14290 [Deltaproteobacteria bacterium]|nr:hypothetical protein [Deltaproteobacteria bacterium]
MTEPTSRAAAPVHLMIVPHTHWDREWYQPFQEFRRRLVRLTDRLLDLLEHDPSFVHFHFDGQTIVLEDYLEIRPEQRARLRRLIRAGRIAIGPWYVLPDEFLVSGESLIRNLLIGHRVAAQFGAPLKIGYLPDQFGHIAQMPQILAGFGITSAVVWRGVGAEVDRSEFLWEAPDGTRAWTVYLPQAGYSNGRSLPLEPARLQERLLDLLAEHAPFRRTDVLLLMNGTDHQEAQAGLPAVLTTTLRGREAVTAEIAPLAAYVERARAAAAETDLPVHRGELRSSLRAHLLPGVTSVRVRQKQRDFANTSCLERYAEPLAVWEDWLAGEHRLAAFTEWAWKLALQNHPHDSICGCSIDQVHQDMEYRFDQVESVGRQIMHQALAALAARLDTAAAASDTVLAVYNPNHATRTLVAAEIYHDAAQHLTLRDAAGELVPLHVRAGASETLLETELPAAEVRPHVLTIQGREFLGLFINDIRLRRNGARLEAHLTVDRIIRGRFEVAAARAQWLAELDDPGLRTVRICARTGVAAQLRFVAPLAGHGLTGFALTSEPVALASPFTAGDQTLENRFYRVSVNPDGSLRIYDKECGFELPRAHWLVDEGDRGDEYNFDALLDPQAVDGPTEAPVVSVEAGGPVLATMRIALTYAIPRRLEGDRETRSSERLAIPIVTTVTLYAELKRIDFETEVDNHAADHRLRVLFQTPVAAAAIHCEQAFAVVRRPLALEAAGPCEQPIGTVPQKTFSCLEGNGLGVALFNRGIAEIEARPLAAGGTELALTLIRAVGWLSRGDLRLRNGHAGPGLETPGGQSPGGHRFAYALTTYGGDYLHSGVVNRAHDFAYPPAAVTTDRHAGNGSAPVLLRCDNPHVIVSALTPSKRGRSLLLRCYNTAPSEQVAHLEMPDAGDVRPVNFLEQASRKRLRRQAAGWELRLRAAEIATLTVTRR